MCVCECVGDNTKRECGLSRCCWRGKEKGSRRRMEEGEQGTGNREGGRGKRIKGKRGMGGGMWMVRRRMRRRVERANQTGAANRRSELPLRMMGCYWRVGAFVLSLHPLVIGRETALRICIPRLQATRVAAAPTGRAVTCTVGNVSTSPCQRNGFTAPYNEGQHSTQTQCRLFSSFAIPVMRGPTIPRSGECGLGLFVRACVCVRVNVGM